MKLKKTEKYKSIDINLPHNRVRVQFHAQDKDQQHIPYHTYKFT